MVAAPPLTRARCAACWDGTRAGQDSHCAVVDLDIGRRDLLQCADRHPEVAGGTPLCHRTGRRRRVRFTSGHEAAAWRRWRTVPAPGVRQPGELDHLRLVPADGVPSWLLAGARPAPPRRRRPTLLRGGDLLVIGGFPGHVAVVVDAARHPETGRRVDAPGPGVLPAQDVHVLASCPGLDPGSSPRPMAP